MTKCLIGLGSNLGDRAATLDAAVDALATSGGVQLMRQSSWQLTLPVGGSGPQPEFLNGAALLETSHEATDVLALLQQIETQHGRIRGERWGSRTLDLDLLLYGDAIVDTPSLTVPHPRMSFRRFVLEPAVEIAPQMVHPTIGWTLEQLLSQLDSGSDCIAVLSRDKSIRHALAEALGKEFGLLECEHQIVDSPLWPVESTSWLSVPNGHVSPGRPKLTILVDFDSSGDTDRGPTLRIGPVSRDDAQREEFAAIEAVWPRLGRSGKERLQ